MQQCTNYIYTSTLLYPFSDEKVIAEAAKQNHDDFNLPTQQTVQDIYNRVMVSTIHA